MWVQRFIFVRLNLTQFRNVRNFEGQCDSGITWHTDTHQKLVHRTPQSTTWTRFTVSSDIQRAKEGTLHYILRYSGWMFWQVLETKHNEGSATINEMTKLAEESIYLFNGLIEKTWIFGSYTIQTTPSLPLRKYLHYLNCWSQSWFFNC